LQYWYGGLFIVSKIEGQRVRNAVLENAKTFYLNRDTFIRAIDSAHYKTLFEFLKVLNNQEYGISEYKPEEWTWLSSLLLDTVPENVSVFQQIIGLAISPKFTEQGVLEWGQGTIQTIFQEKEKDIMVLLAQIDTNQFEEQDRRRALFARDQAIQWLKKEEESDHQREGGQLAAP
jgi:hypothetical protein